MITHTLHFLSLLAFYLGIKLPFDVVWSRSTTPPTAPPPSVVDTRPNGLLGVGTPWIGATKGTENGGWARYVSTCLDSNSTSRTDCTDCSWSTKHPLHVSAAPVSSPGQSPPNSPISKVAHPGSQQRSVSSPALLTNGKLSQQSPSLDESHVEEANPASTSASGSSFTTALAMLLYNVCYLAHTQNVEVPLAQAGEVLSNLWAVCCSPDLGKCVLLLCSVSSCGAD